MTYADRVFKDQIKNIIMENVTDKGLEFCPVCDTHCEELSHSGFVVVVDKDLI